MVNGKITWKRESPNDPKYSLVPNDEVPDTLLSLLKPILQDQLPFIITVTEFLKKWLKENPNHDGREIPRSLGLADYHVTDPTSGKLVRGKKVVMPYDIWMLQRAVDWYEECDQIGRKEIENLLNSALNGGSVVWRDACLAVRGARVKRVKNLLVPDVERNKFSSNTSRL